MAIDAESRKPLLSTITGGLSGPSIKPIALRMVWEVCNTVNIPVVGIGGICTAEDALEFFIAGASAVQIGTAQFVNPSVTSEVVSGLEKYLEDHSLSAITEIVGTLEIPE